MVAVLAPTALIQSCTACTTNSGPLSERLWPGTLRKMNRSESTSVCVDRLQLAGDPDGQALAGERINDVEHPELAAVMGAILDEVV